MRILLDYYRILGVFPKATDEQLRQAYRDRSAQLPRREYSRLAIQSRKQLLAQAYRVLGDPDQGKRYEAQFLQEHLPKQNESETPPSETASIEESSSEILLGIEITPEQLGGSLLIFHELGEYELIIKYGEQYLNYSPSSSLTLELQETSAQNRADIILSLALAYLEISREQWQQGNYDQAALSGIKGLQLLEKNAQFPAIEAEIRAELDKLRPYRILELLAQPKHNQKARETGMQLLKSMLDERQGIDGRGDDRSGLGIDDFLRFIQQIRTYLTAQEQEDLFMAEAQRPSSVAAYLGVYALISRGFVQKNPALILEAQTILDGLEHRQDVSLEQAICALLLAQTQGAAQALDQCQDQQALTFIREQSQGAPDLLPGLCLYGEQWLESEVFSHFRDLTRYQASLKEYFADHGVQAYLEQLSQDAQQESREGMAVQNRRVSGRAASSRQAYAYAYPAYQSGQAVVSGGGSVMTTAIPVTPQSPVDIRSARRRRQARQNRQRTQPVTADQGSAYQASQTTKDRYFSQPPVPQVSEERKPSSRPSEQRSKRRKLKITPQVGLISLAMLGVVGLSVTWFFRASSPLSALEQGQYSVSLHQPLINIPPADAQMVTTTGMLTLEGAKQVIETWLSAKAQAFGTDRNLESLERILANPMLSQWRDRAQKLKQTQDYWTYQHQVNIKSLRPNQANPNQATVEANVQEAAKFYRQGAVGRAYDDDLMVRYELVRQGDRWLIQKINVMN